MRKFEIWKLNLKIGILKNYKIKNKKNKVLEVKFENQNFKKRLFENGNLKIKPKKKEF